MQSLENIRAYLGGLIQKILQPVTYALLRFGVRSNHITLTGTLLSFISAAFLVADLLIVAGVIFLLASSLDILDGALARSADTDTKFGAFLDSTLDRVSEGLIFAAIAFHFAQQGRSIDIALVVLALLVSLLVSYTRARAGALGVECKVGIMTRPERVIIIVLGLFFDILPYAIYLILVLSIYTVAQRILYTYRSLR